MNATSETDIEVPKLLQKETAEYVTNTPKENYGAVAKTMDDVATTVVQNSSTVISPVPTPKTTQQTDENFKDILLCFVCKRPFTDPRMLPCGHTFCKGFSMRFSSQ